MTIRRTLEVNLTVDEIALAFAALDGEQQAEFFDTVGKIAATWPGAGWCQQSYDIAKHMTPGGREVLKTLAAHVLGYDEKVAALTSALDDLNEVILCPACIDLDRLIKRRERLEAALAS